MRRLSTLVALVVLGAALLVSPAFAIPKTGIAGIDPSGNPKDIGTDANGNAKVAEVNPGWQYSQLQPVIQPNPILSRNYIKSTTYDFSYYTSLTVHVSWQFADTTAALNDSLQLELIPYARTDEAGGPYDYVLDLDPRTPGNQGVYITHFRTPLPKFGFAVDSTRVAMTAGSTSATFWCDKPSLARWATAPGALWGSADSSAAYTAATSGTKFSGIGLGGAILSGPALNTLAGAVWNFYYDPPIKIFADQTYAGGFMGSGTLNRNNTATFNLNYADGSPVKEMRIGFYVVNHSASIPLANVTVEVWPKVN